MGFPVGGEMQSCVSFGGLKIADVSTPTSPSSPLHPSTKSLDKLSLEKALNTLW